MFEAGPETEVTVNLSLNGVAREGKAQPRMQLADFLRHVLRAYGTHVGCEHGICGACTVLVDGRAVRSCMMFAVQAEGTEIRTVEGLAASPDKLTALQQAFRRHHALQCGFCTPGILMSCVQFLDQHPDADEREIREMLSGHLCRCTGYDGIVKAIQDAAAQARGPA
jgi:2-furoyl-CoA dehydrogenase 2Fe-2S iron sulfur subunit